MLRRAKRPSELRDSWRLPEIDHQRGRGLRTLRRWGSVGVVTLLGVVYFYLLLSPFWHPRTHFATLSGVSYDAWQVRPLEFAQEDAAAVQQPLNSALLPKGRKPAVALHVLRTPADVTRLTDSLTQLASTQSDVLILYLAAHGVAWDGEAFLLCQNFDPANAEAGRFPVATLLRQLAESSAGVKLLLLDAGRIDYEPRLGLVANDFPDMLTSAVERAGDSRLWVLSSHASMQRAHVDPARRTSVFGAAVAHGLDGAADRSGDRLLDLRELADYVRAEVAANVRRATGRLQTPQLIWGGGRDYDSQPSPLLLAVQSSLIPKQLTGAASNAATKATQRASADPKVASATRAGGQAASLANSTNKAAENSAAAAPHDSANASTASRTPGAAATGDLQSAAGGAQNRGSTRQGGAVGNATGELDESLEQLLTRAWRMSLPLSPASITGSLPSDPSGATSTVSTASGGSTPRGTGGISADGGVASGNPNSSDSPAEGPGESARRPTAADGRNSLVSTGKSAVLPRQFEGRAYFWRAWLHRLWAYEKLSQTGDEVVRTEVAAALRRDLTALESSGELPAGFRVDPSVVGLRAALPSFLPSTADSPTWSLAHRISSERAAPLPASIARWTTSVEQRLADSKPDAWKKLVAEEWPDRATGYFENRFLRELTALPPHAWSLTQLAWQTCRAGQRVATHRLAPALASRLDEADRWQWVARREMTDQIGGEWIARAETCLQQSLGLYLALERDLEELAGALRLRQHWLLRAPEYVR
ncbi:MAG TPA: caspase family protein, partial [Pirellulaceae bacterium]|nr:caspase family protein [Pirellulaceae bacterium]